MKRPQRLSITSLLLITVLDSRDTDHENMLRLEPPACIQILSVNARRAKHASCTTKKYHGITTVVIGHHGTMTFRSYIMAFGIIIQMY